MSEFGFVTGGAGYVGSHACKALAEAGYIPVTLDNFSTGWMDAVKFGPIEFCDLLDEKLLKVVFKKYRPKAIMHFAAFSQVGESVDQPGNYWRNNVIGSLNLIEAAVKFDCNKFIFSSTCATYGDQDRVILSEETPQIPSSPYGTSKRAVEEIIKHFSISSGLKYYFRYFNVAVLTLNPKSENITIQKRI